MKIGNLELKNKVFLAPMAGVTDKPFRDLCLENGCALAYTEMVSAKGMHHNDRKTSEIAEIDAGEKPTAVQIFGSDPTIIPNVVEKLNESNAAIIDINMGCPYPKITKNGDGSALLKNPELAKNIIKGMVKVSKKPITVKMRKGWDESNINAVEFAKLLEDDGVSAVTIHGRTREQLYSGVADWDIIRKVKEAVRIPVIGNGDIVDGESAKRFFEQTNCDAVMIGRAAQGNPWIFREINEYLKTGENIKRPSNKEIIFTIIRHMEMVIERRGEYGAILEMRKNIAWYIKGMKKCTEFREKIFKINDKENIISLLNDFLELQDK